METLFLQVAYTPSLLAPQIQQISLCSQFSKAALSFTSSVMFSSNNAPKMRIFACQASYGDTLALEIDPTPPTTSYDVQETIKRRLEVSIK